MEDEKLYEQLLSLYSELVLQIDEAIKLCTSEREDPKKVKKNKYRNKNILKANRKSSRRSVFCSWNQK